MTGSRPGIELVDARTLDVDSVIALSARGALEFGTRPDVQRSKLWWGYAGSLLRPAVAGCLVGIIPELTLDNSVMVLDLSEHRFTMCMRRQARSVRTDPGSVDDLLDVVITRHLEPLAEVVREAFPKIPIRSFWGNAATSWARAVIELTESGAARPELVDQHIAAVEAISPHLGDKGTFVDICARDRDPVYRYHRRTCCLRITIDEAEPCLDCTVVPRSEWLEIMRSEG